MGCTALGLLLVAEFALVRWLRGTSIREYLATRDRVSGPVSYVMFGVFAVMPLFVALKMELSSHREPPDPWSARSPVMGSSQTRS